MVEARALTGIRPAATIVARVAAGVLGNYAATSAVGALLAVLLALGGMARADAVVAASMIAVFAYLVVLIWAFHAPRLGRLWMILAGMAAICTVVARLVGPGAG